MSENEVLDTGDEKQVTTRKNKNKSKRDREENELRDILKTYGGRAYIWRILSRCGVFRLSFTGDPNSTFFKEGQRDIGLHLLSEVMEIDSSAFQKMQQEAVERDKN